MREFRAPGMGRLAHDFRPVRPGFDLWMNRPRTSENGSCDTFGLHAQDRPLPVVWWASDDRVKTMSSPALLFRADPIRTRGSHFQP